MFQVSNQQSDSAVLKSKARSVPARSKCPRISHCGWCNKELQSTTKPRKYCGAACKKNLQRHPGHTRATWLAGQLKFDRDQRARGGSYLRVAAFPSQFLENDGPNQLLGDPVGNDAVVSSEFAVPICDALAAIPRLPDMPRNLTAAEILDRKAVRDHPFDRKCDCIRCFTLAGGKILQVIANGVVYYRREGLGGTR